MLKYLFQRKVLISRGRFAFLKQFTWNTLWRVKTTAVIEHTCALAGLEGICHLCFLKEQKVGKRKEFINALLIWTGSFIRFFFLMSFSSTSLEIMRFLCCFLHSFLLILKDTSQKAPRPRPSFVPVGPSVVKTPFTISCVTAKWHWDFTPGRGVRKHHLCWEKRCRCFYKRCTRMFSSN